MESEIDVMLEEMLEDFGAEAMIKGTAGLLSKLCKINKKVITIVMLLDGEPFSVCCGPGDLTDGDES